MARLRTFVSVNAHPALQDAVGAALPSLRAQLPRDAVRFVPPESMHVTLKFLGDVEDARVPELLTAVARAAEGMRAVEVPMARAGVFPLRGPPRVVWLGLQDGPAREVLSQLQARVEAQLAPLGFPTEARAYTPHLTLGRVPESCSARDARAAGQAVVQWDPGVLPALRVDAVHLMKSEQTPQGQRYTSLGGTNMLMG